jgi:hypothetical protein
LSALQAQPLTCPFDVFGYRRRTAVAVSDLFFAVPSKVSVLSN